LQLHNLIAQRALTPYPPKKNMEKRNNKQSSPPKLNKFRN
jgi:hypothetical protein